MVEVTKESEDFGPPYEGCSICGKETPFWFQDNDVPLCPTCAMQLDAADVPSKEAWIRMTEISAKGHEFKRKH